MNFLNKLKSQKETNEGLTILIVLSLLFLGIEAYQLFSIGTLNEMWQYVLVSMTKVLTLVIFSLVIINLEKKSFSFAAHLIFFVIFLPDYLRTLNSYVFGGMSLGLIDFLITIVGSLASIYVLAKVFVHKDEIRKYIRRISNLAYTLVIVTVLGLYFDKGLNEAVLYGLIFLAIITSANVKETMPLIIALGLGVLLQQYLPIFILGTFPQSFSSVLRLGFGILIEVMIIYFAAKEYSKKDNDYDNYEFVS